MSKIDVGVGEEFPVDDGKPAEKDRPGGERRCGEGRQWDERRGRHGHPYLGLLVVLGALYAARRHGHLRPDVRPGGPRNIAS